LALFAFGIRLPLTATTVVPATTLATATGTTPAL
jgi:hypothetical protein